MNYKVIILNALLDKYEKSKSYQTDTNRRILLKAKEIQGYDIEDYEKTQQLYDTLKELKKEGWIGYSWEKYQENHILDSVWLNKDKITEVYKNIKRENPKEKSNQVCELLECQTFKNQWARDFKKDMISALKLTQKEVSYLPKQKAKDIIRALVKIEEIQKEVLKRVFSIQCYGDSKFFENEIEKILIRILRKYRIEKNYEKEFLDEEVLAEVGIVKAPEIIEFCGNLSLTILPENQTISYQKETCGSYLNTYTILNMKIGANREIQKVLWIENKTNYLDYISKNRKDTELVIYHGGMYSPIKGLFFQKVYEKLKENESIEFYHWSDIDLGGFKIFTRLRDNIVPELQPYLMDKKAFSSQKNYFKPLEKEYTKKLEILLNDETYQIFHEVIIEMLDKNSKLEQEAFIF